jgi:hypothetical protein
VKPLSEDTPLEVEAIWLAGIRERGPYFQLQRMVELSAFGRQAAREAVRRAHPEATEAERDEILLRELYGDPDMAREVVRLRREQGYYDRKP